MKALALLTGSSQDPNRINKYINTLVVAGLVIQLDPMNKLRNMHVLIENIANQRFRFAIGGLTFLLTSACRHAARTISSTQLPIKES